MGFWQGGGGAYAYKKPHLLPITPARALEIIGSIPDPLARALAGMGYLTGSRVGELAQFTRNSIVLQDSQRVRIRLNVEKKRIQGVKREVPIPISKPFSKCFEAEVWIQYVAPYLESAPYNDYIFKPWGNMAEYVRRKSPEFEFPAVLPDSRDAVITRRLHSHFWRSVRASHLVDYYGCGDYQLKEYFAWSDTRPGTAYVRLRDTEKIFGFDSLTAEGGLPAQNIATPAGQ